jgi:murein DD-endopeptidase MepM/ murein hydrolase activator NlpD
MTRRRGFALLGASFLFALCCALLVVWRHRSLPPPSPPVPPGTPTEQPSAPPPVSTIIDLPGDPVLIRRAARATPKSVDVDLPRALAPNPPKFRGTAYFVSTVMIPSDGSFMGKFPDSPDNTGTNYAGATDQPVEDANSDVWGVDDDGGSRTPSNADALVIDSGNSSLVEVTIGGVAGRPHLKEVTLRTVASEKISDLLKQSGFSEASSQAAESAAKEIFNIQSLPADSVAAVVGALDLAGDYRVTQIAIYENNEYVGAIALAEAGGYGEGAQPPMPEELQNGAQGAPVVAQQYDLADGLYSAGVRNNVPEPIVREAIQLIGRMTNLKAPLSPEEQMRVLYSFEKQGKVIYVGLSGPSGAIDCYSFENASGAYQCFDARVSSELATPNETSPEPPPTAIGGFFAPIKGAPITSRFGMRFHPILHILRLHAGIDFGAPVGSPVRTVASGKVEIAGPVAGFGNHVRIRHDGFETSYSHLSEIPENIKPGASVAIGETIGLSGNTGLSTGPHLHFEFYLNGAAVDPLPHMGTEVAVVSGGGFRPTPPVRPNSQEIAAFAPAKALVDAALAAAAQ